jgi:hypothetical protein
VGIASFFNNTLSTFVSNRSDAPIWLNKLIENVSKNPDGFAARLVDSCLLLVEQAPVPTEFPRGKKSVFIGPTNYSAQGFAWAKSLRERGIEARNLEVVVPGGFNFDSYSRVSLSAYNRSKKWQKAEYKSVSANSHVLIEAERPLFGSLFKRNVAQEVRNLQQRGVSVAMICHGTDIRSPREHMLSTPWSPYRDNQPLARQHQIEVDKNRELISQLEVPVFVSTPDLITDIPSAFWCPVVVDMNKWETTRSIFSSKVPVVVHVPSMGVIKGTHLIEKILIDLDCEGAISYRSSKGVPSEDMPHLIQSADIVLDQFRIGSYGVAAVEAMAAGRLVIGHITQNVREYVLEQTGLGLPILEATPDTLEKTLREVTLDLAKYKHLSDEGVFFAKSVHDGRMSSQSLIDNWISADSGLHERETA